MGVGMVFAFLFGLALGSFLNVCIFRIPLRKSIVSPPSSCPQCGQRIRFYDNIPVVSYAAAYPVALILMTVFAQLLVSLLQ